MRYFRVLAAGGALLLLALAAAPAPAAYTQHNLVSDIQGLADITDTNLVNPWGVSFSATSPFWVSNQGTQTSTLYTVNAAGVTQSALVVGVPPSGTAGPTGQVSNNTTSFLVGATPASFIFANLDGSISAWNGGAGTTAQVKATTAGASYTGLAIANPASGPMLYAANTAQGRIDVFNGSFTAVNLGPMAFQTPSAVAAAGLVPFNVQNIGGQIYVTYAPAGRAGQISATEGQGAVAVFDTSGNLIQLLIDGSKLASPWGITLAPLDFAEFGGDLLVGNFSYNVSEINAFDPVTGAYLGTLSDDLGNPLLNPGLWALTFGNGGSGGSPDTLYLTAGIQGETHGLFASISPTPEPSTAALLAFGGVMLYGLRAWRARRRAGRAEGPRDP
jgi:uncharacterized protein (TIGR03118 family)